MDRNRSTYEGWIEEGRQVVKGERAEEYAVLEDGTHVAVFKIDQTVELDLPTLAGASYITAEEHKSQRAADKHVVPSLKMRLNRTPSGRIKQMVWVGRNMELIALMKNSKFAYVGKDHRWVRVQSVEETNQTILGLMLSQTLRVAIENENFDELGLKDPYKAVSEHQASL